MGALGLQASLLQVSEEDEAEEAEMDEASDEDEAEEEAEEEEEEEAEGEESEEEVAFLEEASEDSRLMVAPTLTEEGAAAALHAIDSELEEAEDALNEAVDADEVSAREQEGGEEGGRERDVSWNERKHWNWRARA